jgi:hypothetical protein
MEYMVCVIDNDHQSEIYIVFFLFFSFRVVDMKSLQSAKLPVNVDRFLFELAAAEGLTKS